MCIVYIPNSQYFLNLSSGNRKSFPRLFQTAIISVQFIHSIAVYFMQKIIKSQGHLKVKSELLLSMLRQIDGITISTNCAPLIVLLFLYSYEFQFSAKLQKDYSKHPQIFSYFVDLNLYPSTPKKLNKVGGHRPQKGTIDSQNKCFCYYFTYNNMENSILDIA